jgi:hypothetical protein
MSTAEFGRILEEEPVAEFGRILDEKPSKKEVAKDILKQISIKGASGLLGAYGSLSETLGLQEEEPTLLPGQQERIKREFETLEKLKKGITPSFLELFAMADDDIAPEFSSLPTQERAESFLELLGIDTAPKTTAGEITGKAAESLGSTAAYTLSPALLAASAAGGGAGELARQKGAPEWLAGLLDLGISLSPAGKDIGRLLSSLKKVAQRTPAGITKLKGIGKKIKKPKIVSERKFLKASETLKKDFSEEINKLTKEKLPFSKLVADEAGTYSRFDNAFKILRQEAKKIPGKKFGGKELFNSISKNIKAASEVAYKSPETAGYVKTLKTFRKKLIGKELSASQWEKQYREINKAIRNLSKTVDISGEKAGKLKALEEIREMTGKSIVGNFKEYPEFTKSFESLNHAYANFKNYEAVNSLFSKALESREFKPGQIVKIIDTAKGTKILKKALGKDGYQQVQKISGDLAEADKLFEMLKVKKGDWKSLVKFLSRQVPIAALGMFVKNLAIPAETVFLGRGAIRKSKKMINNMLLSPKGRRNWEKGVKAIKEGNEKAFKLALSELSKESSLED